MNLVDCLYHKHGHFYTLLSSFAPSILQQLQQCGHFTLFVPLECVMQHTQLSPDVCQIRQMLMHHITPCSISTSGADSAISMTGRALDIQKFRLARTIHTPQSSACILDMTTCCNGHIYLISGIL